MSEISEVKHDDSKIQAGSVNGKPVYVSRTMIASAFAIAAPYIPYVRDWVQADPSAALTVAGVIFGILRIVTTGKVEFKKKI